MQRETGCDGILALYQFGKCNGKSGSYLPVGELVSFFDSERVQLGRPHNIQEQRHKELCPGVLLEQITTTEASVSERAIVVYTRVIQRGHLPCTDNKRRQEGNHTPEHC